MLLAVSLWLTACSTASPDETAQWSAERLYAEAKEEASSGNYERAAKLYERLEGRAAGSVLAQQAQLERAYIMHVLQLESGHQSRTASRLGIDRRTLYRKLKQYRSE